MLQIAKRTSKLFNSHFFSIKKYIADDSNVGTLVEGEKVLHLLLQKKFPLAKAIKVKDISGGCGAIFEVSISSTEFRGLSIVKQHQLINEALKDEIMGMHGIRIHTEIPNGIEKFQAIGAWYTIYLSPVKSLIKQLAC